MCEMKREFSPNLPKLKKGHLSIFWKALSLPTDMVQAEWGHVHGIIWIEYRRTLQRHNTKNLKQIFPVRNCAAPVPISTFVPVSDYIYISTISLPILLQENMYVDQSGKALRHMKVEIRTEAAQFLFWEDIIGICVAVRPSLISALFAPLTLKMLYLGRPTPYNFKVWIVTSNVAKTLNTILCSFRDRVYIIC